jgi:hypothetical protein
MTVKSILSTLRMDRLATTREARIDAAHSLAARMGTDTNGRHGTARKVIHSRETIAETTRRVWKECDQAYGTKQWANVVVSQADLFLVLCRIGRDIKGVTQ